MELISDIIQNPNKLSNNFNLDDSSSSTSSIVTIKCTKALFSKEGLKNNISSYILIIFIFVFLVCLILFLKCGYPLLNNDINDIIKEKEKLDNFNNNIIKTTSINKNYRRKKSKAKTKRKSFPPKKYNFKFVNNLNFGKNVKLNLVNKNINLNTQKNNKKNEKLIKLNRSNNKNKSKSNLINKNIKLSFNNYELNTFSYKKALIYDKRTCFEYYWSLLRTKNLILFSFFPIKDYNSISVKICIFTLSFSVYYAINFSFFDEAMLHKIYEIGGKYEFIYFIPKICISFLISYAITIIIKLIFLSERNIAKIRDQSTLTKASRISDQVRRSLVIKYIIFFTLGLIFLVFFWMLLSSFGAVYQNTQIFIFDNTLISFGISLVFPVFFNIFPCALRICSLNSKEKNSEALYNFSKILQII